MDRGQQEDPLIAEAKKLFGDELLEITRLIMEVMK